MGYISKNIANIEEPKIVTLSALPNFVQFSSKPVTSTPLELNIKVLTDGPLWVRKTFYDGNGARIDISHLDGSESWRTSKKIYIGGRTGQTFTYTGTCILPAFCVFFDIEGAVVGTFRDDASYTGTFPAGAAFVAVSAYNTANPTLVVAGANLLVDTSNEIKIISTDGTARIFKGTANEVEVGGNVYYLSPSLSDTAENIRQALLSDPWIKANFDVVIPFNWVGASPVNGSVINIKSKILGKEANIDIEVNPLNFLINWVNQISISGDTISGEASTAEIELDVYVDADIFLGEDDRPITTAKIGHYLTTLSKTYTGSPLWFELNALFAQYPSFNLPPASSGWFNTGTSSVYRFIAKVKAVNSFSFYQSNALYVINGYGRVTDEINLEEYIYGGIRIKLLTNKPRTPYIRGQREYLNFILKDDQRGVNSPIEYVLRVCYQAYSTAGDYLGEVFAQPKARAEFQMVNTCVLTIDEVLDQYPTAGLIKVMLSRDGVIISNALEYTILPECLHTLQQFSFLNRLGGWDAFNFDAAEIDEIKPESTTYNKTLTPDHKKGDSLETVYSTSLANPYTIEGAPVYDDVAEWLKELAAAKVILNNNGEYVILEDFELKRDPAKKNMQTLKVKYRLSENYTND